MKEGRGPLLEQLRRRLPEPARGALERAVALAEGEGLVLYLVGGGVRDLLLEAEQLDIDLVVERDALRLASTLGAALDARVVTHPRFGTAVVRGEGFRLDLAGARTERYQRPGALPSVRPSRLADDLARRDFTINAMALPLNSQQAGRLIDPHGGRGDLVQRQVRVLHSGSFQDDATRILRALRYAARLGFRLEPRTEALLRRHLPYLDTISSARLRHEFERIAAEERGEAALRLAGRLGVLAAVHPALRPDERAFRALGRLSEVAPSHRDAVLFALLLACASQDEAEGAIGRLALTGRQAETVRGAVALREQEQGLARASLRPSEAVRLLARHPAAAVEAFALFAQSPGAAERARRYLREWRFVRPRLNGRDVEALGVPHGPQVGAALAALQEARLDGRASTRADEIALVQKPRRAGRPPAEVRRG